MRRIPTCLATTTTRNLGPPNLPSPGGLGFPTGYPCRCCTTRERTFSAGSLIHTRQNASFPGAAVALGPTPASRARRPIYIPIAPPRHLLTTLFWLLSSLDSLQSCAVLPYPPSVPNFWSGRANSETRTTTRPVIETQPTPEARTLFAPRLIHTYHILRLWPVLLLAQYRSLC